MNSFSTLFSTKRIASFVAFSLLSLISLISVGCGDNKADDDIHSDSTKAKGGGADTGAASIGEAVKDDPNARYALRLAPKRGDVYTYEVTRQQNVTTGDLKSTQEETYDFALRVVSVNDDGSMVLGMTYNRVRAVVTAPSPKADSTGKKPILDSAGKVRMFEQTIRFDTQTKNDVPGGERYRAFIGRETLVTMDRDGKVQDVANVDPILNATLKGLKVKADTVNPRALEIAKQGIRFEIGTMLSLLFFRLAPDSAVGVGASWSQNDSIPIAGGLPAKTTYTYTLASIREADDERLAQVTASLRTRTEIPKKNVDNDYISMKIESVDVGGDGESVISVKNGFPVSKKSTIRASLSGTGSAKQGADKGKSQKITYKESTSTSIKRLSWKPGTE